MLFALGFVFMFTVGGLNYNQIVFPINMTIICWELLTITVLIILIILVKIFNLEQSAGPLFQLYLIKESESSETTNSHRDIQRVFRKYIVQIRKSPLITNNI
jgi:hypothetical protein